MTTTEVANAVPPPPMAGMATPMPYASESEAIRRAQAGDGPAFDWLFSRYETRIFNYLLRLFGGDYHDAADHTQDTFFKAYLALTGGKYPVNDGHFQGWLYRIATNVHLDAVRHRSLVGFQNLEDTFPAYTGQRSSWNPLGAGKPQQAYGHTLTVDDAEELPPAAVERRECEAEVSAVLRRLPRRYRAALLLREWHGLSYDELAAALGVTRSAIKTLLFRARASFGACWREAHPDAGAVA